MYDWTLRVLLVFMAINSTLMFIFPSVIAFPDSTFLTILNPNLTYGNVDLNKLDYSTDDLRVTDFNSDANSASISSGVQTSYDIPWYSTFVGVIPKMFKLVGNLLAGWFPILSYFGVPSAIAYAILTPLLVIEFIGLYFLVKEVVSAFAGIIGFFT